jgi:hypothetical protein
VAVGGVPVTVGVLVEVGVLVGVTVLVAVELLVGVTVLVAVKLLVGVAVFVTVKLLAGVGVIVTGVGELLALWMRSGKKNLNDKFGTRLVVNGSAEGAAFV